MVRSDQERVPVRPRRMSRRALAALSAFALLLPGVALVVPRSAAIANTPDACDVAFTPDAPALGTDANADKYLIASEENLVFLSVNFDDPVDGGSGPKWLAQEFVQTAHLDLEGCDWNPIGYLPSVPGDWQSFTGSYDGGGHMITGLTVAKESDGVVGMFRAPRHPTRGCQRLRSRFDRSARRLERGHHHQFDRGRGRELRDRDVQQRRRTRRAQQGDRHYRRLLRGGRRRRVC